ncbi:M23 family metallopeptidase, partial [Streptococcus pyogenes]
DKTYQSYLSQLWQDLNGGDSLKSMLELSKEATYKLSDDDREDLKELSEEGTYLALQELDNPFQGQTEDDALTMTVRYGYEVID